MLVVATEQLCGKTRNAHHAVLAQQHVEAAEAAGVVRDVGIEAGEHRLRRRHGRRHAREIHAGVDAVGVVAQVDRDEAVVRVDVDAHLDRNAVGQERLDRVVAAFVLKPPAGQLADRLARPPLRIVEPFVDEVAHRLRAVLIDERLEPALADPCGADGGEVVAEPLVRHTDAAPAHAHDVVDVAPVALHLDAGEDQRALVIDVLRRREVGGGLAVAHVRLMRLHAHREEVLALVEHRHQDRVIGRVAVAAVGVVVEIGVALAELRVPLAHDGGLDVHAEDVDRHGLRGRQHLVVRGDDGAGKIPRDADDGRARAVQHGVGHLAADRVHAVGHDREVEGAEPLLARGLGVDGFGGRCVVHEAIRAPRSGSGGSLERFRIARKRSDSLSLTAAGRRALARACRRDGRRLRGRAAFAAGRGCGLSRVRQSRTRFSTARRAATSRERASTPRRVGCRRFSIRGFPWSTSHAGSRASNPRRRWRSRPWRPSSRPQART